MKKIGVFSGVVLIRKSLRYQISIEVVQIPLLKVHIVSKMASQTQGIQQLLAAEKRAAEKVAEAKKRKARRLKQAKEEAQDDINKYTHEREIVFREYEAKFMGSRDDVAARIESETKLKIDEMNKAVASNKENVIDKVLDLVYEINPELHKNFRAIK